MSGIRALWRGTGSRRITNAAFEDLARKVAAADVLVPQLQTDAAMYQSLTRRICPNRQHRDWWTEADTNAEPEVCPWCEAYEVPELREQLAAAHQDLADTRSELGRMVERQAGVEEQTAQLQARLRALTARTPQSAADPAPGAPPWAGPLPTRPRTSAGAAAGARLAAGMKASASHRDTERPEVTLPPWTAPRPVPDFQDGPATQPRPVLLRVVPQPPTTTAGGGGAR